MYFTLILMNFTIVSLIGQKQTTTNKVDKFVFVKITKCPFYNIHFTYNYNLYASYKTLIEMTCAYIFNDEFQVLIKFNSCLYENKFKLSY